ncbi:MAG: efflux transporter outer membrane subunit [Methylovirgula sp.]
MRELIVAAALANTLAGCSLAPDYHRPTLPVASSWPTGVTQRSDKPVDDIGWRDFFVDPVTQELIALSLANNRDLRVAALNVAQAQAQYRVDRASLFPTINGTGGLDWSSTPGDTVGSTSAYKVRQYSLGLGAVNWELDLFGKIRNQAEQAKETFLSDANTQLSTQISLVAQVASAYLAWLSDRDALKVSEDTVKVQADSLNLTQLKVSQGSATALDAAQAETTLRTAQASVSQYKRQVAQDLDEIVLLVGTQLPDDLTRRMNKAAGLSSQPKFPVLQAGLPADLLLRRPDIRAAEHTLLGANANIGAARAAFFPEVTLTGNYGTASNGLKHLFGPGQAAWLFEPTITVPIFDAGKNEANLDIAEIQARSDIANYEKTIQAAFHDVADALVARTTYATQVASEQALVAASSRYYQLADTRFRAGADNYLNVLLARNSLFSAQLTLISLKLSAAQDMVTLYKALGGGWQEYSTASQAHIRLTENLK